jgi:hypothetical protein
VGSSSNHQRFVRLWHEAAVCRGATSGRVLEMLRTLGTFGRAAALTQKGYSCEPANGRPSKLKIGVILQRTTGGRSLPSIRSAIAERATGALHKPAQRNAQQFSARTHLPPDWLSKAISI